MHLYLVKEIMLENYGLYVWPSALILMEYICINSKEFKGKNILELGCGCSLPGLTAYIHGASSVLLTDTNMNPLTLNNCFEICQLNGFQPLWGHKPEMKSKDQIYIQELTWGQFPYRILRLRNSISNSIEMQKLKPPCPDMLIGADIFYDLKDFEKLLATIVYLNKPLYTVYQHRGYGKRALESMLDRWGMKMRLIPFRSSHVEQRAEFEVLYLEPKNQV